jgi:hypothetical protein
MIDDPPEYELATDLQRWEALRHSVVRDLRSAIHGNASDLDWGLTALDRWRHRLTRIAGGSGYLDQLQRIERLVRAARCANAARRDVDSDGAFEPDHALLTRMIECHSDPRPDARVFVLSANEAELEPIDGVGRLAVWLMRNGTGRIEAHPDHHAVSEVDDEFMHAMRAGWEAARLGSRSAVDCVFRVSKANDERVLERMGGPSIGAAVASACWCALRDIEADCRVVFSATVAVEQTRVVYGSVGNVRQKLASLEAYGTSRRAEPAERPDTLVLHPDNEEEARNFILDRPIKDAFWDQLDLHIIGGHRYRLFSSDHKYTWQIVSSASSPVSP